MSDADTARPALSTGPRVAISKGLVTIGGATVLLFVVSALAAHSSVSGTSLRNMLQIASVLAVAGLGQMLVIQQGGIDLSVAGGISIAVVVVTHVPDGDDGKLVPAILLALVFALGAGLLNGALVGVLRLNPIIATLGTNALLYGADLGVSGGRPRITTQLLARVTGGTSAGIPHAVWFALAALAVVALLVKRTVAGRRFEAVGANPRAARAVGLRVRVHGASAYLYAQLLYCLAGVMLGGITAQPSAFEGDSFLLVSVAVVVLGGTSLLGGRGYPLATVVAAVFLEQLVQFVVALGVSTAVQTIVQAVALAIGVSLYTVDWKALRPAPRGAPAAA
jgi:ribose transport system permease protein